MNVIFICWYSMRHETCTDFSVHFIQTFKLALLLSCSLLIVPWAFFVIYVWMVYCGIILPFCCSYKRNAEGLVGSRSDMLEFTHWCFPATQSTYWVGFIRLNKLAEAVMLLTYIFVPGLNLARTQQSWWRFLCGSPLILQEDSTAVCWQTPLKEDYAEHKKESH
jgi:hypothetical protein